MISQLREIDLVRLRILQSLPGDLRFAGLISVLQDVDQAQDFARLVDLLESEGCSRDQMQVAVKGIGSLNSLRGFARRWAQKVRLPDHPVPPTSFYRPIVLAAELARVAIQKRNCLRSYLPSALEGRTAFALAAHKDHSAVVSLVRRAGNWCLDDVYGYRNSSADVELVRFVVEHLARHGVAARPRPSSVDGTWAPLSRLMDRGHGFFIEG